MWRLQATARRAEPGCALQNSDGSCEAQSEAVNLAHPNGPLQHGRMDDGLQEFLDRHKVSRLKGRFGAGRWLVILVGVDEVAGAGVERRFDSALASALASLLCSRMVNTSRLH